MLYGHVRQPLPTSLPCCCTQVVAECLAQQADVLHIFGRFAFTMPDAGDPQYEQKATVAVQALLKDMEAAELLQEANRIMASHIPMRSGSSSQQAEQAEPQQQEQVQQQQGYGIRILRSHLERPDCMQLIRRLHQASVEELAGGNTVSWVVNVNTWVTPLLSINREASSTQVPPG